MWKLHNSCKSPWLFQVTEVQVQFHNSCIGELAYIHIQLATYEGKEKAMAVTA